MLSSRVRFLLVLTFGLIAATSATAQIQVPAGTEFRVTLVEPVNSKHVVAGDTVAIRLLDSISVGGIGLVAAGATGTAIVDEAKRAGKPGKSGMVSISLHAIDVEFYNALDDKMIMIEAVDSLADKGSNKTILSILLGFGLFIKGGEGVLLSGQPIAARTTENVILLPREE